MKAKVSRGGGFRGALDYVLDQGTKATGDKNPEIVGGNLAGVTPREMSREFSAVRKLRPDIGKPVWHCSLSLPPGDRLAGEKWDDIATDFMTTLGFPADTPYTAVRHQDTDKDHIHIVASRVSLAGEVWHGKWEARRAIEATQELEKRHGLTLTPGLGDARAEKKALTRGENNMAFNTGVEPPRQKLRRLVDEALKDGPGALDFAERLQAAGVQVRPNIASTGKMNGFSFKIDGVPMKGQDLGAGYKWAGLQKRGVTYEQDRDCAGLERFKTAVTDSGRGENAATDHSADERQHLDTAGNNLKRDYQGPGAFDGDQHRVEELAQRDSDRGGEGFGAIDHDSRRREESDSLLRPDISSSAPDPGESDVRAEEPDLRATGSDIDQRETDRRHEDGGQRDEPESQRRDIEDRGDRDENLQHGGGQPAEVVETMADGSNHRGSGRSPGPDWSKRFKQNNAAKRAAAERSMGASSMEQSHSGRAKVTEPDRLAAREIDPTAYLESQGYTVKPEGRGLSAQVNGDEVYRLNQKDGHWVWCDNYNTRGGDNIALVREIQPRLRYIEAVYQLSGGASVEPIQPRPAAPPRQPPKLPVQHYLDRVNGRDYLQGRGISQDSIDHAEKSGMVQYANGGVLFVGRDESGTAQNVTRRATTQDDTYQKRDLKGTDKSYPPILPGDPAKVWIVEGGADALALHDVAKRSNQPVPTVIVSGGANVRSFFENEDIQKIMRKAEKVTVCGEKEKDKEAQDRADQGHKRQADRVKEITGKDAHEWTPPTPDKDLAELNVRQQSQAEQIRRQTQELIQKNQEQEEQRAAQQRQQNQSYPSPGMSR